MDRENVKENITNRVRENLKRSITRGRTMGEGLAISGDVRWKGAHLHLMVHDEIYAPVVMPILIRTIVNAGDAATMNVRRAEVTYRDRQLHRWRRGRGQTGEPKRNYSLRSALLWLKEFLGRKNS